jgi:hypothetical protein
VVSSQNHGSAAFGNDCVKTFLDAVARSFDIKCVEIDIAYVSNLDGVIRIST